MKNIAIIGAQWGDEGKGKVVDVFAAQASLVARYAGGANAGHTLKIGDTQVVVHQLPSGVARGGVRCIMGAGMVVDPAGLLEELDQLNASGFPLSQDRLLISDRAHMVLPFHRELDARRDSRKEGRKIGTTGRGIGPCYEDKAARRGLRVGDLQHDERLAKRLALACDAANQRLQALGAEPVDPQEIRAELDRYKKVLLPFIGDAAAAMFDAQQAGERILLEGAQGVLLDIDHGTYPYVTSSSAVAGGACAGVGVSPARIDAVVGVAKAYLTRVGEGPFPTELHDAIGEQLREAGGEYGATTGRPRRCGWLDLPALRYAVRVAGVTHLALTKLDVLGALDEFKVCTGYRLNGQSIESFPSDPDDLAAIEPVLETHPGFGQLGQVDDEQALPEGARQLIAQIESAVGVPVGLISVGPARRQTLIRTGCPAFD